MEQLNRSSWERQWRRAYRSRRLRIEKSTSGIASVAFGTPGMAVVMFVGFGQAAEPGALVVVRSAAFGGFLCAVQGPDEIMDEQGAIEWEWGHFFPMNWTG